MPDANPRYFKLPRPESIQQFIRYVNSHKAVLEINNITEQNYEIKRIRLENIVVHITNIYIVSEADVLDITSETENLDALITISAWNHYTIEAKELAKSMGVGLFTFREFMGALHFEGEKFLDYKPKKDN